jgi:hypothetical protein
MRSESLPNVQEHGQEGVAPSFLTFQKFDDILKNPKYGLFGRKNERFALFVIF